MAAQRREGEAAARVQSLRIRERTRRKDYAKAYLIIRHRHIFELCSGVNKRVYVYGASSREGEGDREKSREKERKRGRDRPPIGKSNKFAFMFGCRQSRKKDATMSKPNVRECGELSRSFARAYFFKVHNL